MDLIVAIEASVARQNYSRICSPKFIIIKPNQNRLLSLFQLHYKAIFFCLSVERKQANSAKKLGSEPLPLFWIVFFVNQYFTNMWMIDSQAVSM
jgi:hypothetical protein